MAGRIIEAKAVISAADKTGGVFDKIAQKMKGVEKVAKSLSGVTPLSKMGWGSTFDRELSRLKATGRELNTIQKSWESFNAALARGGPMPAFKALSAIDMWKRGTLNSLREVRAGFDEVEHVHRRFFRGAGRFALTAAGIGGGAYALNRVGRAGITAAATSQRESARDYLSGMTKEDSDRIAAEALRQSVKFRSIDASTMHERLRDTAMGMRSTDKALALSETIAEGTTVLQSLKGKDQAIEEGRKFFAALDVLGKNIDPKEVRDLFSGYIKALGVEGADMNLGGVFTMAKRLKSAGATISNRFLMTTGVGLARDMGEDRAGNALEMMMQQEVQATAKARGFGLRAGLRGRDGRFVDRSLMMSDPDLWAWKHITAAMKRVKLDPSKAEDVKTFLQGAYSNSSARDVLSKLMTQRTQYEAKAVQFEQAPGLKAAAVLPERDPFVAMEGVFAQLRNLATQAPMMDAAASGLNSLSGGIANFTKAMSDSTLSDGEKIAAGVAGVGAVAGVGGLGVLTAKGIYGWFTSGNAALTSSAAALDGAAAALTNAAIKLGAGSKLDDVFDPAGKPKEAVKKPGFFGKLLGLGGMMIPAVGAAAAAYSLSGDTPEGQDDIQRAAVEKQTAAFRKGRDFTLGGNQTFGTNFGSSSSFQRLEPNTVPGARSVPSEFNYKEAQVHVEGNVAGEATVNIKIEAPELIKAIYDARSIVKLAGSLGGNGPGSAGHSSPDAGAVAPAAPATGASGGK